MPLLGLAAICVIWLITQFASVAAARAKLQEDNKEHARLAKELNAYGELPGRLAHAEGEAETLKLKAAAVTLLTHKRVLCTRGLEGLAETTPATLRLTSVLVDTVGGTATLKGYGSAEKADIDVATFVRTLNANKQILSVFEGAELDYCTSTQKGENPVKQFSVSLVVRKATLEKPAQDEGSGQEPNG